MDVMELRRRIITQMTGISFVGIKQSSVTMSERSNSITFPVIDKPWGFLIARSSDGPRRTNVATRVSGIWTEYNGGGYVGGRHTMTRANGSFDHYAIAASAIVYDDAGKTFTVTISSSGAFDDGETYYLWYFTVPF